MCVRKTPLAEVFHSSLATVPENSADTPSWYGRSEVLVRGEWPARWEPQEESMMSIAADFPSVKKPRFIVQEKSRQLTAEGDAC
jgi:hypothetical protein